MTKMISITEEEYNEYQNLKKESLEAENHVLRSLNDFKKGKISEL